MTYGALRYNDMITGALGDNRQTTEAFLYNVPVSRDLCYNNMAIIYSHLKSRTISYI